MKKSLIAIAVAGAMSLPLAAQAADDAKVSGFVDVFYTATNDGNPNSESQFNVAESEVDIESMGVRIDVNQIAGSNSVEQANFTVPVGGWNLTAGTFNSGLSADNQDAPDMNMSSWSGIYDFIDNAGLSNLAGVSLSGMAGPANIAVSMVNDGTTVAPDQSTTFALLVSGSVMDGLDVELGYVDLDAGPGATSDINLNYTMEALRVNLDYLTSDTADGYSLLASYGFGGGFSVAARADSMTPDAAGTDDETSTTFFISYALSDNAVVNLESKSGDNTNGVNAVSNIVDGTVTTLELLGTF